jgi:hypothetical protein
MTSNTEGQITEAILAEVFAERCHLRDQLGYDSDDDDKDTHGEIAIAAATRALLALPIWENADSVTERRKDMIIAAAMLVAEVERIDRAEALKMVSTPVEAA